MSNDPLESFFVPKKQTPEPDSMPSMRAASAKPVDARREPKLSTHPADQQTDAKEKAVTAGRPAAERIEQTSANPTNSSKTETSSSSDPIKRVQPAEPPAEKTKKELKAAMRAAKQTARQAERRDRHRKSRGSRLALYLMFIVAAGFVLAVTSNLMIQSMEKLRDARAGTAASATAADQPTNELTPDGPN